MRVARIATLAGLTLFLLYRGIIPAWTSVDTDFPNYYTSSRLLIEGKDLSRIYDDEWFQERIHEYGIQREGKFSPFPPMTALVMVPFAFLGPLDALRAWTVVNIGVLAACVVLLSRIVGKSWEWSGLLFLSSGHALANNFRFGQLYLVMALFLLLGYLSWPKGGTAKDGTWIGLGAALKYFPAVYLPLFLVRREWKALLAALSSIAALVLLSGLVIGFGVYKQFVEGVIVNHLAGNIQNPYSTTFQSWNSLFRNLFVYDEHLNSHPLIDSPNLFLAALVSVYAIVFAMVVFGYRRIQKTLGEGGFNLQFVLVSLGGIVLLPASATYHMLFLTLPVAILLSGDSFGSEGVRRFILLLYFVIGFIPYSYFHAFEKQDVSVILAYPRLLLVTLMFGITFLLTIHASPATNSGRRSFALW